MLNETIIIIIIIINNGLASVLHGVELQSSGNLYWASGVHEYAGAISTRGSLSNPHKASFFGPIWAIVLCTANRG